MSLSLVTGSNGIIGKAAGAVEANNKASIKEEAELVMSEWKAQYYLDGTEITDGRSEPTASGATVTYKNGELVYKKDNRTYKMSANPNGGIGEVDEEPKTKDQAYNSRHPSEHIPTGFSYKEGTVETGYVIKDEEENEFVWIPVASSEAYSKKLGKNNRWLKTETTNSKNQPASSFANISEAVQGDILGIDTILGTPVVSGLDANTSEYDVVASAGGFWVGRYEAGIANVEHTDIAGINGASKDSTTLNAYWESKKTDIVVKQDTEPVRNIMQNKALEIANGWKTGNADEEQGTVAFQSGLITGAQWDAMCNFIGWDTCDNDCRSWGNYGNVKSSQYTGWHSTDRHSDWKNDTIIKLEDNTNCYVFPTGRFVNENGGKTVKKNIYDVAGNVWEWTTEVPCYSQNNSVLRCGSADNDGSEHLATLRNGDRFSTTRASWNVGFRLVLYVE